MPIHPVYILVAGEMSLPRFRLTADGFDIQFGIDHLGYYLLSYLLRPLVKKATRAWIVMIASVAHYDTGQIPCACLASSQNYDRLRNYCGSKLATVMFVRCLAKALPKAHPNITAKCLHPGSCNTNLFKNSLFFKRVDYSQTAVFAEVLSLWSECSYLPEYKRRI
ncbi:hypothetical protein FBU30_009397 [Linnemannia zychae]|nr:hypothetical protein FBU30_009397 [Linnemannia zychae]